MNRTNRSLSVLGLVAIAGLTACQGQGNYTRESRTNAEERLTQLKSGVEWQAAERQFLAGDLPKAQRTIERSIMINPRVAKSHVLRGRIMMEQGNYEEARASMLVAEELAPGNVDAQYFLGIIAERTSQFAQALERYTRASKMDPANPQYIIAAAEMNVQLGNIEEGQAQLAAQLKSFPTSAALRHTLGQIGLMRSDLPGAERYFTEARMLAPDDLVILEDLARTQMSLRNFAAAEQNLGVLLAAPDNADRTDLQLLRVRCLAAMERMGDARVMLSKVLDNPALQNDAQAWILMGNLAARLDDVPRLRQSVIRISAIAPDRPEGHALKAMLLRLLNRPQDAQNAIETAISIQPNDPEQWVLRGLIQAEMGDFTAAKQSLDNAAQLDPRNRNAQALLAAVNQLASQPVQTAGAANTPDAQP
jgi:tetratricopeptide (TPR) repeat protein